LKVHATNNNYQTRTYANSTCMTYYDESQQGIIDCYTYVFFTNKSDHHMTIQF